MIDTIRSATGDPLAVVAAMTLILGVSGLGAQDAPTPPEDTASVRLMILGTYHFASPGQDAINVEAADVMTPEKQAEIRAVVDDLAAFAPTKVALEYPRDRGETLDSVYQAHREGRHELTPNERQQLGFRVAARMGHERVHAVDWRNDFALDEVVAWAQQHDPSFMAYFQELRERIEREGTREQGTMTVGEILRRTNAREEVHETFAPYMRTAEVGADSVYVGIEPVVQYYERNLRIFANLARIAEPGDRILVIFGSGHSPFLRAFVRGHPGMVLVDPLDYL
ncbi:MAG: hypothetical protein GWM92_03555 [Gemmatimonadetes bacterium]|nr:hypothetical protein [Gemmatimonadota bacterium]NIR77596.1 hypothetical protein [Gemmatimonadota bacterium]NIT86151.1 hypothetical protein [Gemmatimonadota bacterium]NIU29965.1 hypothetical protein [Gemmatimonadota bacterium]NIU34930.1 hypothetical protein [Gemmatimonadota bacterium]